MSAIELGHAPRYGDRLTLRIERISTKGAGATSIDALVGPQKTPRAFTVHVRKAMVGDLVDVVVEGRRRNRVDARIETIREPSPHRVNARCSHFGAREEFGKGCGGCTLQALAYPAQLDAKHALIQAAFSAAELPTMPIDPVVGAADPWRYRNKMEFSFGDDRERRFALGLYPTGWRNEVVPLRECHLVSTDGTDALTWVRDWCAEHGVAAYKPRANEGFLRQLVWRRAFGTDDRLLDLVTSPLDVIDFDGQPTPAEQVVERFAKEAAAALPLTTVVWTVHRAVRGTPTRFDSRVLVGRDAIDEVLPLSDGRKLQLSIKPRAFFQPNPRQASVLADLVLQRAAEATGGERVDHIVDLYCGTGMWAMVLAPHARRVSGLELVPAAVEAATRNAAINGVDNATFVAGDVAALLADPQVAPSLKGAELVVVDPPRAGLSPKALDQLVALAPHHIVYVSCNPRTLATNLAELATHGYRPVGAVTPVDQFPHTPHVECVALLEKA